jgi:hypothetical protein
MFRIINCISFLSIPFLVVLLVVALLLLVLLFQDLLVHLFLVEHLLEHLFLVEECHLLLPEESVAKDQ